MLVLILLLLIYGGGADRILNKTAFYSYLFEYTVLLNQTDIIIDTRCPLGGLYRDSYCIRTFSPGCSGGAGGILINGRCRKRTAPVWTAVDDIDVCTLAGAGPAAYLNRNIWAAAKKKKSFLYCIDILLRISPSPNLAYALYISNTLPVAAIGGGVGGGVGLFIFCGVVICINRLRRTRNYPSSIIAGPPVELNIKPIIITPKPNPIRISELEYARHQFSPIKTRRVPARQ